MDKGIHAEHCLKAGSEVLFTAASYNIMTCPSKEYKYAKGEEKCPDDEMLDQTGKRVRVIRPWEELRVLKVVIKSNLKDCEILLVVRLALVPFSSTCLANADSLVIVSSVTLLVADRCCTLDLCFR